MGLVVALKTSTLALTTLTNFGVKHARRCNSRANKAKHGDAYYIAASPSFRSRACWLALPLV